MTDEQIIEWAEKTLKDMRLSWIHNRTPLMNAARTLIASVRAEAIEEAAKVCDAAANEKEERCDNGMFWCSEPLYMASRCASAIRNLLDRALVKERKGEE